MRFALVLLLIAGCTSAPPAKPKFTPKVRPVATCECGCGLPRGECHCFTDPDFGEVVDQDCPQWRAPADKPPPRPDAAASVTISDEQMDAIAVKVGELLSHALKTITLMSEDIDELKATVAMPAPQDKPPAFLPVKWNPALFTMSAFPVSDIEPKRFKLYAPKWCKHCPAAVAALTGDAEIDVEVIDGTIPGLKQVPCLVDVAANHAYYGSDIASMTALRKRLGMKEQTVGFSLFNLGTIKREDLIDALSRLNDTDSCPSLGNREQVIEQDGAIITLPTKFGVTWKTEGQRRTFTFTRPVAAKWGLLSTTLNGMTWDGGDAITVKTGTRLMQGTITVED